MGRLFVNQVVRGGSKMIVVHTASRPNYTRQLFTCIYRDDNTVNAPTCFEAARCFIHATMLVAVFAFTVVASIAVGATTIAVFIHMFCSLGARRPPPSDAAPLCNETRVSISE